MADLAFSLNDLPEPASALRREVRAFIDLHKHQWTPEMRASNWTCFDKDFSRALGDRGWIGMTWPRQYGGHERSAIERYVVLEELLAAGAPCGAHWIADRQSGPLIIRLGNTVQKALLPRIVSGELSFCIGLSEPDAGSDLASLRSRAVRGDGGWRLNGRKVWTTNAHRSDYMIGLFRSGAAEETRHAGLSQFLIDLRLPGISIRPIRDLTGNEDFNEVTFDDVLLPEAMLLGEEGNGWAQATAELTLERSGPERYLSSFTLVCEVAEEMAGSAVFARDEHARTILGRLVAHHAVLREMSLSVAGEIEAGRDPALQATVVKDMGNDLEQSVPGLVREMLDTPARIAPAAATDRSLAYLTQASPSFSLRGGTREILRGIIARGLGLR
jgi:alkylation response protein AidB-like acyl-CoA dehydrogenase